MRKEILIAILIGSALGLVITYTIWSTNTSLTASKQASLLSPAPSPTLPITPTPKETTVLGILDPEDNAIIKTEKYTLKGKTSPFNQVVILYNQDDKIIQADDQGNFSAEIILEGGNNDIIISAFAPDGSQVKKTLSVTYTTTEI